MTDEAEIARLRLEVEHLREALSGIADCAEEFYCDDEDAEAALSYALTSIGNQARQALTKETP